jgi:hypothetical protein
MMRRCGRVEELRQALAAEKPMSASLAAHVAACSECARMGAAARRFDARLEAVLAELVTDALPSSTATVARTAPSSLGRRTAPGTIVGGVMAVAFVAFAVVGAVTTASSISDAMRSGAAADPEAPEQDLDRVDCYLGESTVEVTVERVGDVGHEGIVAYCFGVEGMDADREAAMTCAQSKARAAAVRRQRELGGAGEVSEIDDAEGAYLGTCTSVEGASGADGPAETDPILVETTTPFGSWDEAAGAISWPVLRPGWLPDGYELAALQRLVASTDGEAIDSVTATYLRNGILLRIDQFETAELDVVRVELGLPGYELGEVSAGQTTVGEHPAYWATGVAMAPGIGPGSEVHTLVLSWSDDSVGYRITSRNQDLDTLERIAESLTDGD